MTRFPLSAAALPWLAAAFALASAGCASASREEQAARDQVRAAGARLHPAGGRADLPVLKADAPLADYLRFALLNHPAVEAAYADWRAAVLAIGPARALPDPRFTFEADVTNVLEQFMPGLMFDFMTPGKRAAMAREATAASGVARRNFVSAVLAAAAETQKAWIELAYVDEAIRLRKASVSTLDEAAGLAAASYTTSSGMASLDSQLRLINDLAQTRSQLDALGDRRAAVRARFKSSLGLLPGDADPPWPQAALQASALPDEDELWRRVQASNPGLGEMRAMVDMALAGVEAARRTGTPDFQLGGMVDLKMNPLLYRPLANVTLPIWREKIAATVAAARARQEAASARVNAGLLEMAAQLAQMLSMVRESDRMIGTIDGTVLPNLERIVASTEAGYQTGISGAAMIPETRLMALNLRLERAAALRDRETAATGLLLMTADIAPATAPLITGVRAPAP